MTNSARIDHVNKQIVMDRTFAKNAEILGSTEYNLLQTCRKDYPDYTVVRRQIKKNAKQNHYRGLTYGYMKSYIISHEKPENVVEVLDHFSEMLLLAACQSNAYRYPVIKKWFLNRYPEISQFGMPVLEEPEIEPEAAEITLIVDTPVQEQELGKTG